MCVNLCVEQTRKSRYVSLSLQDEDKYEKREKRRKTYIKKKKKLYRCYETTKIFSKWLWGYGSSWVQADKSFASASFFV